jgi:hypothetical protein
VSTIAVSILESVKKAVGVPADYDAFDSEIIMHTNSIFSVLTQLGVGPAEGYQIEDADPVWSDFLSDVKLLNLVKTYISLRVRMLFDPPTTSFLLESTNRQIDELEWRINVIREEIANPTTVLEVVSP